MTRRSTSKHATVSVRGTTYQRLCAVTENVGQTVDELVASALDDPEIARQIAARCGAAQIH